MVTVAGVLLADAVSMLYAYRRRHLSQFFVSDDGVSRAVGGGGGFVSYTSLARLAKKYST